MLVRYRRLAVAGVVTAAAMAVPAAALASGPGSTSVKPAPPPASAGGAKKPEAKPAPPRASTASAKGSGTRSQLPALAASAGISVNRLQVGLAAAKRAGGNTAASVAAFAASTGVSRATAQRVVHAVFGTGFMEGVTVPAAVRALAMRLGVSVSAAGHAFKQIAALSNNNGGVDPARPAFAAIARDLRVSPAQLAVAWDAVKQSAAS